MTMREHLQPWYDRWLKEHADTNLIYAKGGQGSAHLRQVHFVRNHLAEIVWEDVPFLRRAQALPRHDCRETAFVVGEHTSKSVRLPVYSIERPDLGIRFVLRENFYDWNVSVVSETDVTTDLRGFELDYPEDDRNRFPNGFTAGKAWGYCFFQGFPVELQFGPYSESKRRFSTFMATDYEVSTFVFLIMRDRRGAKEVTTS